MSLATRHGPMYPHRKSDLPGGYMAYLATMHGRRCARREDALTRARKATDQHERAMQVRIAREWHKLALEAIVLMRLEQWRHAPKPS